MSVTVIKPHVQNNSDCYIIADGKKFAIVMGEDYSYTFTENDSENIVKAITSFNTAKIIKLMKMGRSVGEKNIITIPCENSSIDGTSPTYQFINIEVSAAPFNLWSSRIFTNGLVINLPVGVIDDLYKYLVSQEIQPAVTFGAYNEIRFVDSIPENPTIGVAYVLTKDDGERDVGNAYMFNGRRLEVVSDTPVEADPEDPATIPDSLVKEEAPQTVGSASEQTTEVWDKAITAKTTVEAAESVSIVNSTLTDGSIAVTIA